MKKQKRTAKFFVMLWFIAENWKLLKAGYTLALGVENKSVIHDLYTASIKN
jgi:hypothetical protein